MVVVVALLLSLALLRANVRIVRIIRSFCIRLGVPCHVPLPVAAFVCILIRICRAAVPACVDPGALRTRISQKRARARHELFGAPQQCFHGHPLLVHPRMVVGILEGLSTRLLTGLLIAPAGRDVAC